MEIIVYSGIVIAPSLYRVFGELYIRPGEEVVVYVGNCGQSGNTYIDFDYQNLANPFQVTQGVADTSYISYSSNNGVSKKYQFSEDAIIEIHNLVGHSAVTPNGVLFAVKVFVVPFETTNDGDTIPIPGEPLPFITQSENTLNITVQSDKEEQVEMYNSLGQKIKVFNVTQSLQVDLTQFGKGVYSLIVKTESETVKGKVIVY